MIKTKVSVVIPVYNDYIALRTAIPATIDALEKITHSFELIIAEDASIDGSCELAAQWTETDIRIHHLHRETRSGRGSALEEAARIATGSIFCYIDVDLATDIQYLNRLIQSVEDGYDAVIGSRLLPGSTIVRSTNREIQSRGYNLLVRSFLGSKVHDHQCGFKAFNRTKLVSALPYIENTHWFWDTEVLVYFQRNRYQILEIPVTWNEGERTTAQTSDIFAMFTSILKLWRRNILVAGNSPQISLHE